MEAAHAASKKSYLEFCASEESMMPNAAVPTVITLPPRPAPVELVVSDITSQKIIRVAADRPRGLLCYLDEMNGWVRKMTDKNSGDDRSSWVVGYESAPYSMQRVSSDPIYCENYALSIYGNIQPRVYREAMMALSTDGMLQRFIPAILNDSRKGSVNQPIPDYMTHRTQWEQSLRLIYAMPERVYQLSEGAYNRFRKFQYWYEDFKHDEHILQSSDIFMTSIGKLEGTAGRLILMFHMLENPFAEFVDESVVERVVRIIETYIIPAFRFAYHDIGGADSLDGWLVDHIIQNADQRYISLRDLKRSANRQLKDVSTHQANRAIITGMVALENARWVIRSDDASREHNGIAEWIISDRLLGMFKDYRAEVDAARARRKKRFG
jgi:hypothetical protein